MDEEHAKEAFARVGKTVGKYRLEGVLGVGGTAAVYAASHRNGNRVAVKVLHPTFAANEEIRGRFLREGYVANKVDHPGTMRVLDDESGELTYLVMDLLEGETLDVRATRAGGVLAVADAVHHAISLLDVLERAHASGIVHRDIKPENLFFTTRQELKVLDFGIARLRDGSVHQATKTQVGTMLGTPAFLAPEQALGQVDRIDARTDLWAVGATLFTLISGRLVHQGRSAQETLAFAATNPASPLKTVAPHVPDSVAQIVDRALRFQREERWSSAAEMKHALLSTGLARITLAAARAAPLATAADASRHAATILTSTAGARASSSTSAALAGALFGIVALGGIVGGLLFLKRRNEATGEAPVATTTATASAEPEIEQLPLPSAAPVAAEPVAPPPVPASASAAEPTAAPSPAADDDAGIPVKPRPVILHRPTAPAPTASQPPRDPWDPRTDP